MDEFKKVERRLDATGFLALLPDDELVVFLAQHLGFTQAETARILKVSQQAVSKRFRKAQKQLRKLARQGGHPRPRRRDSKYGPTLWASLPRGRPDPNTPPTVGSFDYRSRRCILCNGTCFYINPMCGDCYQWTLDTYGSRQTYPPWLKWLIKDWDRRRKRVERDQEGYRWHRYREGKPKEAGFRVDWTQQMDVQAEGEWNTDAF